MRTFIRDALRCAGVIFSLTALSNSASADHLYVYQPGGSYILQQYWGPDLSGVTTALVSMNGPGYYPHTSFTRTFAGMFSRCENIDYLSTSGPNGSTVVGVSPCYVVEPFTHDPLSFHPEFWTQSTPYPHQIPVIRRMGLSVANSDGSPRIHVIEYSWQNPQICNSDQTRDPATGVCVDPPPPPPEDPVDENPGDDPVDESQGGPNNGDGGPAAGGGDTGTNSGAGGSNCDPSYIGNPCNAANGNKYQHEVDFSDGKATLEVARFYNSRGAPRDIGLGHGWTWLFGAKLQVTTPSAVIVRPDGRSEKYTKTAQGWQGEFDSKLVLIQTTTGYELKLRGGVIERYDTNGRLVSVSNSAGRLTNYSYDSSGKLIRVTGPFGHAVTFAYNGSHVASFGDSNGQSYFYTYDVNNNLTKVTYPNNQAKIYHYENASFPHHLTGISYQESSGTITRYSTYAYDNIGRAVLTEHAGGMQRATLQYDSESQATVRDAANTPSILTFNANLGMKKLVQTLNTLDGKSLAQTFDANNNLICKKDEEGRVTTYTYNAANQKTSMTEGLFGSCASPTATSATRTTTYQYLSTDLDLPTEIASPSVHTGLVKQNEINYVGNLPSTITQRGFTPAGNAISRTITLSYNTNGQVTSVDGPRTDVNDVTTLSYYNCTTGNQCGQLQSVTNAAGHVTTHDSYDANGRVTQITDTNGLRTNYVYDVRGRVSSMTVSKGGASRITAYTYNAANNVTSVTFPDSIALSYTHDAAQKLRQVVDNVGNKVTYNYDLKGNLTQEATYDPNGTLVRGIETAYDIRNRVSQINNGGSITQQVSDAIGNLTKESDPNQVATHSGIGTNHSYDALNRLFETVNTLNGVTSYNYDINDRLTQVKAPNNATTGYLYDDLGNLLSEASLDRGTISYSYDAAGNVISITDARGVTVNYVYDVLGRVTAIDYPDSNEDVTLAYDSGTICANGVGRLCQAIDGSGVTQYAYDVFGNINQQQKGELGITYITRYTYDAGNRITSMTYPDDRIVTYTRDTLGRITGVTMKANGGTQTIIAGRTYRADGSFLSQTYGNGLNETRQYDLKGQLNYQSLGGADTRLYQYDANGNLTHKQTIPEVGAYQYDALDRLVNEAVSDGENNAFTYDANGNRLVDLKKNGKAQNYLYESYTNRLIEVGKNAVTLDPAGNTISDNDGKRRFIYNNAGRLIQVKVGGSTKGTYTYNYLNQRTRKERNGNRVFVYHYDLAGNVIAETHQNGKLIRAYAWANGEPIAQIDTKGSLEQLAYLHTDHLGTPRIATDGAQAVIWRFESEAFGTGKPEVDADEDETKTNVRLRFAGQYYDSESGLFYNWNRYYDPRLGRYVTYDPLGVVPGIGTPLTGVPGYIRKYLRATSLTQRLQRGINQPYGYTQGNPLRWTDASGLTSLAACANPVNAAVCAEAGIIAGRPVVPLISPAPILAVPKPGSKPKNCPTGTLPIDIYPGLDKDDVHGIKEDVHAGPEDWTGIAPNGDVITGDHEGNAQNNGPYWDYLPGNRD